MSEFINTVDVIGDDALLDSLVDGSITEYKDNVVTKCRDFAFRSCSALTLVDLPNVNMLEQGVFSSCIALATVILRSSTMCVAKTSTIFYNTKIEEGTGYIYVPTALVNGYKSGSNWSNWANQIRALEDYTVDGTTTGELDPTKI